MCLMRLSQTDMIKGMMNKIMESSTHKCSIETQTKITEQKKRAFLTNLRMQVMLVITMPSDQ